MIRTITLLLLASCQYSEGQSSVQCGCNVDRCMTSEGVYATDYAQQHYVCPFTDRGVSYCSCLPSNHFDSPSMFCSCDDPSLGCEPANCYYHLSCEPCAGKNCKTATDSCDWYSDCLDWQFPECSGDDNYALNYGQVYCNKYNTSLGMFSDEGKQWITSVRLCLQEALIPQLSAEPQLSCVELKKAAFESHEQCYTSPGGDNSICQLSCRDLLSVMWTIKGAFIEEFMATIKQGLGVTGTCVTTGSSLGFKICMAGGAAAAGAGLYYSGIFRIISLYTSWFSRQKRSVDCDEACLAEGLAESIFNNMNLPAGNSIEWFAFPETSGDKLVVTVLLSDLAFVTNSSALNTTIAALESAAKEFHSVAISRKKVTVGGEELEISEVSTCGDLECAEKTTTKVADESGANEMLKLSSTILLCVFLVLFVIF